MTLLGVARPNRADTVEAVALMAALGVYIGVLYHLMVNFIAPTYTYLGYTYQSPDPLRNAVIIGFVLVLTLLMPRRLLRVSHFVLWMHFVLATVPSMLVPQFTAQLDQASAFNFALAVGLAWSGVLSATSGRARGAASLLARRFRRRGTTRPARRAFPGPSAGRRWTVLLAAVSLTVDVIVLVVFGLSGELVGLTQVRDVRLGYREAIAAAPPGTAYVVLLASNVLNPLVMMRALVERRWWLLAVGATGQVLVYATAGYKMVLLSVPAVIALYLWLSRPRGPRGVLVLGGIAGIMTAAWASFVSLGSTTLSFLFVMRAVVAPGNLSSAYVAIFQDREPLYWSYSFLGRFIDYPYDLTPNYLVGKLFRGDPEVSANVNLFGDGYMSMRWGGIALESCVLIGILLVLDRASRELSLAEAAAALLLPTFALCNSNIFTSLTTHGLLAATVLLALVPSAARGTRTGIHRASPRRPAWARKSEGRRSAATPDNEPVQPAITGERGE